MVKLILLPLQRMTNCHLQANISVAIVFSQAKSRLNLLYIAQFCISQNCLQCSDQNSQLHIVTHHLYLKWPI